MDHRFQVNLSGIIRLLSDHLYSGPHVYLRELLQNSVDALQMRAAMGNPEWSPAPVRFILGRDEHGTATLCVEDNGVGLTEEEVHRFLATIGQSSKNGDLYAGRQDFIGQFGIGLLSCFLVSESIEVHTRSARAPGRGVRWAGHEDGTYTIDPIDETTGTGTRVTLRAKTGFEPFFEFERVCNLLEHFGGMLETHILVQSDHRERVIGGQGWPWRHPRTPTRNQMLTWGQTLLGKSYQDAIPLQTARGDAVGVAFVRDDVLDPGQAGVHRVYLKGMFLSDRVQNLLPTWAFFLRCVVNADGLNPIASRESLREDEALHRVREELGVCVRRAILDMAIEEPERLQRLVAAHASPIAGLASRDDEAYRLLVDWFPFETTQGRMLLGEIRKTGRKLYYTSTTETFSQLKRLAAAQGMLLLNCGYTHSQELLERITSVYPEVHIEELHPQSFAATLDSLTTQEQAWVKLLVQEAERTLRPFDCRVEVRRFEPTQMSALYSPGGQNDDLRKLRRARELATGPWGELLDDIGRHKLEGSTLCLNLNNPLIQSLIAVEDAALLKLAVRMLYTQSLMMGQHALTSAELHTLGDSLGELLSRCLTHHTRWIQ